MMLRRTLLIMAVLLAGLAIMPWLRDPVSTDNGPQSPTHTPQARSNFNDPAPLAQYDEIIQRPVFVASRRPAAAPAATSPGKPGEVLLLDLYPVVGVVVAGEQRLVLIRKATGDTVSRIAQGEELDGWTLTEVSRERLVLEKAGNRKEVFLQNNNGSTD